jgi:hypothetical protein
MLARVMVQSVLFLALALGFWYGLVLLPIVGPVLAVRCVLEERMLNGRARRPAGRPIAGLTVGALIGIGWGLLVGWMVDAHIRRRLCRGAS